LRDPWTEFHRGLSVEWPDTYNADKFCGTPTKSVRLYPLWKFFDPGSVRRSSPLVNGSIDDVLFKVKPSLPGSFSQIIDVMRLCFVHTWLHSTPNKRHVTLVHFSETMIHLMQFSSVISRCNNTFSVFFRISQR